MDGSPTPQQTLQLLVEIDRTADGRLEGRIRPDATKQWTAFSGVLELLKVLEELVEVDSSEFSVLDNALNPALCRWVAPHPRRGRRSIDCRGLCAAPRLALIHPVSTHEFKQALRPIARKSDTSSKGASK
jgi:hypothetical protein